MKILPIALLRLSPEPFSIFNEVIASEQQQNYFDLIEETKIKNIIKNSINDLLFNLIGSLTNTTEQINLLKLKRDIYNERRAALDNLEKVDSYLPSHYKIQIEAYKVLLDNIENLNKKGQHQLSVDLINIRSKFWDLTYKESLQKGLQLSSSLMYSQVKEFQSKSSINFEKKTVNLEKSLLKYISRIYSKTSPFSTFTNLNISKVTDIPNSKITIEEKISKKIKSHIKINNYLFQKLLLELEKVHKINQYFLIRLNPTLEIKKQKYYFISNKHNNETFQELKRNKILDLIVKQIKLCQNNTIYKDFIEKIFNLDFIEASQEELRTYLDTLISFGFLETRIGISSLDSNWDSCLISFFKKYNLDEESIFNDIIVALEIIRLNAKKIENAGLNEREFLLNDSCRLYQEIYQKIRALSENGDNTLVKQVDFVGDNNISKDASSTVLKNFPFKPEHIYYEDTTANLNVNINEEFLRSFISKLNFLIHQMSIFEFHQKEKDIILDFYLNRYEPNSRVSLLKFYREFFEYIKNKKDNEKNNEFINTNLFSADSNIFSTLNARRLWSESFKEKVSLYIVNNKFPEEILLSKEDVNINHDIQIKSSSNGSFGAFIQFYKEDNANILMKGYVELIQPGLGKMFSRFLPYFDKEFTNQIYSFNKNIEGECLLIEHSDYNFFNANIHPPLLDYELLTPGSQNTLSEKKQISATDLKIYYDKDSNQLAIYHSIMKKRVYVENLGLQQGNRSEFFKFLTNFGLGLYIPFSPISDVINSLYTTEYKENHLVNFYPRIIFENEVIIQRKKWLVTKETIPKRNTNELDFNYSTKIKLWFKDQNIPEEFYITINNKHLKILDNSKFTPDDVKPQYINLKSIVYVLLFEKIISKCGSIIQLEEMLPDSNNLFTVSNNKYVTEFLINWGN